MILNSLQNPDTGNVTQSIVRISNRSAGLDLRLQIIFNAHLLDQR